MTWIKTVPYEQADDELRRAYESVRALYPIEYATQIPSLVRPDGTADRPRPRPRWARLGSVSSPCARSAIHPRARIPTRRQ